MELKVGAAPLEICCVCWGPLALEGSDLPRSLHWAMLGDQDFGDKELFRDKGSHTLRFSKP